MSGHKIGGPKGIGILIKKNHVNIEPLMYGGEQEFGLRPGTTNTPSILSITEAIEISLNNMEQRLSQLELLHDYVFTRLRNIPELTINSPAPPLSATHIINFSYTGVNSALLISILAKDGIIVSSQSACSSRAKTSRVLMAMTKDEALSSSSLRLSFHESITLSEVEYLMNSINKMVEQIKSKKKYSSVV